MTTRKRFRAEYRFLRFQCRMAGRALSPREACPVPGDLTLIQQTITCWIAFRSNRGYQSVMRRQHLTTLSHAAFIAAEKESWRRYKRLPYGPKLLFGCRGMIP